MRSIAWFRKEGRAFYDGMTKNNRVFSSTKTWASIAYGITCWVVIHQELKGTLSSELVLILLAVVAGHNALMRSSFIKQPRKDSSE